MLRRSDKGTAQHALILLHGPHTSQWRSGLGLVVSGASEWVGLDFLPRPETAPSQALLPLAGYCVRRCVCLFSGVCLVVAPAISLAIAQVAALGEICPVLLWRCGKSPLGKP